MDNGVGADREKVDRRREVKHGGLAARPDGRGEYS